MDPESVRVAADGLDLALLNVEVHGGYRTDPLREEAARLRSEADRCRVPSRRLTMRTPSMLEGPEAAAGGPRCSHA